MWLFIAAGEVVTVLDGPNVTLLRRKVLEECEKEELIAAGAGSRTNIAIQDAVPGKVPRFQGSKEEDDPD